MRKKVLACVAAAGVLGGSAAAAPAAEAPVALIMAVGGAVAPEAAPYSEVGDGTSFELGEGGRLTFVHYPSCRLATVAGGRLTFTQLDVQIEGGAVENEAEQKCPRQLKMKIAGVTGGVRLRSIPTALLAEKPSCALVGPRSRSFAQARVLKGEQEVARPALKGAVLAWPADAPALEAEQLYRLELLPADVASKPVALDFAVAADAPAGPSECLLRVE